VLSPVLRAPWLRARRRALVLAAAVLTGLVLAVALLAGWAGGGSSGVSYVGANHSAVLYAAGHRPLAPDFSSTTLTGAPVNFSSYRGKVVVLNFWGSWCDPCRAEAPALGLVAKQYQPTGVVFLGVDERDTTASAEAFTRNFGITYPSLNDPSQEIALDFTAVVPLEGTPTTLVIDRTGHIAGAVFDSATYPELTAVITSVTGKAGG
jgi:thiol-disulfide isomerase/thioredoxin